MEISKREKETDLGLVLKVLTRSVGSLFLGHRGSLAPQPKPMVPSLKLPAQPSRRIEALSVSETILWQKSTCQIQNPVAVDVSH